MFYLFLLCVSTRPILGITEPNLKECGVWKEGGVQLHVRDRFGFESPIFEKGGTIDVRFYRRDNDQYPVLLYFTPWTCKPPPCTNKMHYTMDCTPKQSDDSCLCNQHRIAIEDGAMGEWFVQSNQDAHISLKYFMCTPEQSWSCNVDDVCVHVVDDTYTGVKCASKSDPYIHIGHDCNPSLTNWTFVSACNQEKPQEAPTSFCSLVLSDRLHGSTSLAKNTVGVKNPCSVPVDHTTFPFGTVTLLNEDTFKIKVTVGNAKTQLYGKQLVAEIRSVNSKTGWRSECGGVHTQGPDATKFVELDFLRNVTSKRSERGRKRIEKGLYHARTRLNYGSPKRFFRTYNDYILFDQKQFDVSIVESNDCSTVTCVATLNIAAVSAGVQLSVALNNEAETKTDKGRNKESITVDLPLKQSALYTCAAEARFRFTNYKVHEVLLSSKNATLNSNCVISSTPPVEPTTTIPNIQHQPAESGISDGLLAAIFIVPILLFLVVLLSFVVRRRLYRYPCHLCVFYIYID